MGGKAWDEEELELLESMIGNYSLDTIARKLCRSREAVKQKIRHSGIGYFSANTEFLKRKEAARVLGVDPKTLEYWEGLGLRSTRKVKPFILYSQQNLVRFLKEHSELWNARRVVDDSMFENKKWFLEKKAADEVPRNYFWSRNEIATLRFMIQKGYSDERMAEALGRTLASVRGKIYQLGG